MAQPPNADWHVNGAMVGWSLKILVEGKLHQVMWFKCGWTRRGIERICFLGAVCNITVWALLIRALLIHTDMYGLWLYPVAVRRKPLEFHPDRNRSVIQQADRHIRAEFTGFCRNVQTGNLIREVFI